MPIRDLEKRRENHKRYMREVWYPQNRKKHIATVAAHRGERHDHLRALIIEHKFNCVVCGETEPVCLDFHHTNPDEKDGGLATAVSRGWCEERIIREIQKCVVLCANCHRKFHANMLRGGALVGTLVS